jgi:hypothetical protein
MTKEGNWKDVRELVRACAETLAVMEKQANVSVPQDLPEDFKPVFEMFGQKPNAKTSR